MDALVSSELEDRMAVLAARSLIDPDERERAYAKRWLEIHWRLHEAQR